MIKTDASSNTRTSRRNLVAAGVVLSALLTSAPSFAADPTPAGVVSIGSLSFPDWGGMWPTFTSNPWQTYLILSSPQDTFINAPFTGGNIIFRGFNTGGLLMTADPNSAARGWIDSASVLHIKGVTTESGTLAGGEAIRGRGTVGVHGISTSQSLLEGVLGEGGIGVRGTSSANTGVGVWGEHTNGGIAGLFLGEVRIQTGPVRPVDTSPAVNLGTSGARFGTIFLSTQPDVASDLRLKKDIHDLAYGLSDVLKLRPVSYKLKSGDDDSKQLGLIAQEVDKVIPDVVVHGKDPSDNLSMRYEALVPVLIKAIQEQQARISDLEKRQQPVAASFYPSGLGAGIAIGLVPLGLAAVLGRLKTKSTRRR